MPCFKGIAVSVHSEGAPLPEYSVQKQSRVSRVNTYIPVPQAKIPKDISSNKPEPSKFAISITLLTPGLAVPYSTPKPTSDEPYPRPTLVAGLPTITSERGQYGGIIGPYIPITKSENETIAAYIYFDGRPKEEVATLLRPGEETWVNSRWVQVPDAEGGGLAEREFLFREVGLERWLNGLDLEGEDAAAKLERRRQRFEKRRRRKVKQETGSDDDLADAMVGKRRASGAKDVLRYGNNASSPVENLSDEDDLSDLSSDDDAPPEATGQIKVAMFRVLASGEIKRGEYSPQFDAHDDDDITVGGGASNGKSNDADIDHTTSFAKPKTLDPKSISTQTVTGIDGPEKPYAVFTFFYRGERQLQKMGILESSKAAKATPTATKRRSAQLDFGTLKPLSTQGTVGFTAFRETDAASRKTKARKKSNGGIDDTMNEDSEDDDDTEIVGRMEDVDDKDVKTILSPEDVKYRGELADGVDRIKLKRQHSADGLGSGARKSPSGNGTPATIFTPPDTSNTVTADTSNLNITHTMFSQSNPDDAIIGSPMKRQRGSIYGEDSDDLKRALNSDTVSPMGNVLGKAEAAHAAQTSLPGTSHEAMDDEEL